MLRFFRRGITAKLMLILLGLVLVAIVITGFGAGGMGLGELGNLRGGGVARVDGRRIGADEIGQYAQRQLDYIRRQQPDVDMATLVREGAIDQLIDQLMIVDGNVVFARDQGLAATRAMVDREIASIPRFQNAAGQFDDNLFRAALQTEKVSEAQIREDMVRQLLQRQLLWPVQRGAEMPKAVATRYAAMLLEKRSGIAGVVPAQAMAGGKEPTDAEVAAYYKSNIARYTIPERRVIRYASFGADQVAARAAPTDAEIAKLYKDRADQFAAREERTLQQVVFQSEADAKAFAAKLSGGTDFAAAARQSGRSAEDIAVGKQTREAFAKLASPEVAAAAFALPQGGNTAPIKSPLGWHVVHVADIGRIAGQPLSAVRGQLADEIRQRKSAEALADLAAKIDDAIVGGASFEEVAKANGLEIEETPPVTAAGLAPDDPRFAPTPEVRAALEPAFQMAPEDDAQVVTVTPNQKLALVSLARIVPAAAPPLAGIHDRVKSDLAANRALERARAVATAIVAKINGGTPPAKAFAEAKIGLPPVQPMSAVRRDLATRQQVPPPLAALFSMQKGKARMVPAPNGAGWFVVYLDSVATGDPSKEPTLVEAVRGQLGQSVSGEYEEQFSRAVLAGLKTKRDEKAIAELKAKLASGSAP